MTRAARDRRVFYFEEPVFDEFRSTQSESWLEVRSIHDRLFVVRPHLAQGCDAVAAQELLIRDFCSLHGLTVYDTWYYTPMAYEFTRNLRPSVLIYDCMDELGNFMHAPPQLVTLEEELLQRADLVFTGGRSLYESKRGRHPHVFSYPSSIDPAHFEQALSPDIAEPQDQAALPHPRAGFYGVIDERFDIDLLREVARLRPDFQFVMLGPIAKIDANTLPRAANIHYPGSRSYDELPAYLSGWDVALLPFSINDATRYISPTKTPEYLAAGRRVISTPVQDVVTEYGKPGLVTIAGSAAEFAAAMGEALQPPDPHWRQLVRQTLQATSWDMTWNAMQADMDAVPVKSSASSDDSFMIDSRICSQACTGTVKHSGNRSRPEYDVLVAGAGFAGSVLAERLASQRGKRVLVVDQRDHIAGNAYDHRDAHGVLVHRYGPHIFHTNSSEVVAYLSQFTEWHPYEHRVLASVHGRLVPLPINITTLNVLYGLNLDEQGMRHFLQERCVPCADLRTSEDIVLSRVGRELYETFFRGYTRKQWGLDPSELDAGVAGRIPVRYNTDDRYFSDTFQAMPLQGYTRMFERMLDHPGITVQLSTSFQQVAAFYPKAHIVFTGPIDEYFDFCYGPLPYRSLTFRHEHHSKAQFQQAPVVNFPNDHAYTRITEFKKLTGQIHAGTSIVYEYPAETGDPYYPIPRPDNTALYARYRALADRTPNVTFCGRLANYRYFNMDQVVAQALKTFRGMDHRGRYDDTVRSAALWKGAEGFAAGRMPMSDVAG